MAMARAGSLFHTLDVDIYLRAIDWHIWGENVGYTPGDVGSVHQAFMESPTHREHILDRAFRQVAIGSVRVDGTLWVTVFFLRLSPSRSGDVHCCEGFPLRRS